MAQVLDLYQTANKRVLSSRQTARAMTPVVSQSLSEGNGALTIDMARMTAITPSFFDELIRVIEDSAESRGHNGPGDPFHQHDGCPGRQVPNRMQSARPGTGKGRSRPLDHIQFLIPTPAPAQNLTTRILCAIVARADGIRTVLIWWNSANSPGP